MPLAPRRSGSQRVRRRGQIVDVRGAADLFRCFVCGYESSPHSLAGGEYLRAFRAAVATNLEERDASRRV